MDKSSFKFTAEQVRNFLGLNNDYVDSSSSSSLSDNSQNESNLDFSSLTQTDSNESGNETLIPPLPKRIKTVTKICKHGQNKNHVFRNTCTQVNTTGEKIEHEDDVNNDGDFKEIEDKRANDGEMEVEGHERDDKEIEKRGDDAYWKFFVHTNWFVPNSQIIE